MRLMPVVCIAPMLGLPSVNVVGLGLVLALMSLLPVMFGLLLVMDVIFRAREEDSFNRERFEVQGDL